MSGLIPTASDDPAETHAYLRVRPTGDSVAGDRITEQCEQLHGAVDAPIECLLVGDPAADEIRYYLGAPPDTRPVLERVLARLLPDTYAIERVDGDPLAAVFDDGVTSDEDASPAEETDAQQAAADTAPAADLAAVTFQGVGERHNDWMTRLRPPNTSDAPEQHQTARVADAPGLPLASLIEGLAAANGPVVYQALARPHENWGWQAEDRITDLEMGRDTLGQRLANLILPPADLEPTTDGGTITASTGDTGSRPGSRIEAIRATSQTHSFAVNARLVAAGPDAASTCRDLGTAFEAIGGDYYYIRPVHHEGTAARDCLETVTTRTFDADDGLLTWLRPWWLPGGNNSPRIVADATTVPHFLLFDGATLSETARTALRAVPAERTGLPAPNPETLDHYDTGLAIGRVLGQDSQPTDATVAVPPSLQPLHQAWYGKTGSGKSVALSGAITANHTVTDGADIVMLPKGGSMALTLLRSHYIEHGDLEDVYYFDCREVVPAVSFFDIRDDLAAGVSRTTAVQDRTDHYLELVRTLAGTEAFDSAIRSPDVIRYLVKALFDAEYGADAFTHRDLQQAVRRFRTEGEPPLVGDPDLRSLLAGVAANDDRSFDRIMQGVANRIEKVPVDDRLARVFNHVPGRGDSDRTFAFDAILNEDALVIFDMGGLRTASQQGLALVLLSNLWTALRRRTRRADDATAQPLVNLYLEEAADFAVTDLLSDLLTKSREFRLSVTLAMQFPGQLRETDPAAYADLMNNVSTVVTGNVAVDTQLQQRLATDDMPPEAVGNRLRALSRGEWLVSLPAPFDEPEPQPFVVESLPLPPGHPEADDFTPAREAGFDAERAAAVERTRTTAGLPVGEADTEPSDGVDDAGDATTPPTTDARRPGEPVPQVDSALPTADRLPEGVDYDRAAHAIVCTECKARYEPTVDGIRRAVGCCLDEPLDRNQVPICEIPLTLSERERTAANYTHAQLLFLQAVYTGQQGRFDPLAFDLRRDGMDAIREDCGLSTAAVEELIDDGLLRHDTDEPSTLYTVTADGRDLLKEPHRAGDAHGHGIGDVAESSLHTLLVDLLAEYIRQTFGADEASSVVDTRRYYDAPDDDYRYDAVGLDADGTIVVAGEAERPNNDRFEAVPADYDKLSAADPTAAIWVTRARAEAHAVLNALNNPADGSARVDRTYSVNSPPTRWRIDEPGFTELQTATMLRRELDLE